MTWRIGSGFGAFLQGIISNHTFQDAAIQTVQGIGERGLELMKSGMKEDKLRALFTNLTQHSDAVVGAMVKGTEVESKVDPEVVQAVTDIKTG